MILKRKAIDRSEWIGVAIPQGENDVVSIKRRRRLDQPAAAQR
jgi:hypothetical protein